MIVQNFWVSNLKHNVSILYLEYTDIGGDEELPLGQEFQDHIHCFIEKNKKNARDRYKLTGKLVQQLS